MSSLLGQQDPKKSKIKNRNHNNMWLIPSFMPCTIPCYSWHRGLIINQCKQYTQLYVKLQNTNQGLKSQLCGLRKNIPKIQLTASKEIQWSTKLEDIWIPDLSHPSVRKQRNIENIPSPEERGSWASCFWSTGEKTRKDMWIHFSMNSD